MTLSKELLTFWEWCQRSWSVADFLLAAFVGYLSRIGATKRFDIGYADERQREWARVEGFFASSIHLRIEIDSEQNFEELLNTLGHELNTIRQHKTYGRDIFARIPELKKTPRFSVVVERVRKLDNYEISSESESCLTVVLPEEGTECCWVCDPKIFDSQSIARMQCQFAIFASAIATDPTQPIARLNLLSPEERYQLLVEWNNTQTDYPQSKCIHQLFEEQVERTPDAVAVVFENEQLTYRQLNSRANQLAHYLQSLGVGLEVLVRICVERSIDMVVGFLGILKAGGAYVPLDPNYPTERLNYMLSDSEVPVLLTESKLVSELPSSIAQVILLDSDWDVIASEGQENPVNKTKANNLAFVIYTSGSTGRPKGVLIRNSGLINLVLWHQINFAIASSDRSTQIAGTAFDAAVWELWPYLTAGATIYLVKAENILDPEKLRDWLLLKQITITFVPTPLA